LAYSGLLGQAKIVVSFNRAALCPDLRGPGLNFILTTQLKKIGH
jgi:hypothetical protein